MGFGDFVAGIGKGLDEFGKTQLGPALGEVGKGLDHFGQHHLGPALGVAGQALDEFTKNQVGPALGEVGKGLDEFGKNVVGPALGEAGKGLDEFRQHQLVPALEVAGKTLDDFGKNQLGPAMDKAGEVAAKATGEAGEWIGEHPEETTLIAGSALAFLLPGIISKPVLWALGWTSVGPKKASPVAMIQARTGNVVAQGAFATVQSAAMGGYGEAIVGGVVRFGAAILAATRLFSAATKDNKGPVKID